MLWRGRSSSVYPCSHCVIFHGFAILQHKTNGNPIKWAPSAIKEVILLTILKNITVE
jgi:hypothetical protein